MPLARMLRRIRIISTLIEYAVRCPYWGEFYSFTAPGRTLLDGALSYRPHEKVT